jgi:putative tryptophan/tyrosine transport system substrate-binding protein
MLQVTRRQLVRLLGGAAVAWPVAASAQQPAIPVIGFLSSLKAGDRSRILPPFTRGLDEAGFADGRNVKIEYRFAEAQYERLPALAAELVRQRVTVIAAISGTPAALAAKTATTTIPIVFAIGFDPVRYGLVASLNRPTENLTGVTFFSAALGTKRVELLRELVPKAKTIALLVNPDNPHDAADTANVAAAVDAMGLRPRYLDVRNDREIESAFAALARERSDILYVWPDPLFTSERSHLALLTAKNALPAIYSDREIAEAGGLMSYGASRTDAYFQAGIYTGRILRGDKPTELPVVLPTKFEFVINLKTAKALGLQVPDKLLALADEVIE